MWDICTYRRVGGGEGGRMVRWGGGGRGGREIDREGEGGRRCREGGEMGREEREREGRER